MGLRFRLARYHILAILMLAALILPPSSSLPVAAGDPTNVQLAAQPLLSGFTLPTYMVPAGDGSGRLFVVEQAGRIQLIKSGTKQGTPFLDISSLVAYTVGGERGLYTVAFSPHYATDGNFYVNYARFSSDASQLGDIILARYHVSANADVADVARAQILLTVPHHQFSNHNGGTVAFGPDGYLYMSIGDGGSGGDPNGNGQNTQVLLGKMLRLDVSGVGAYTIPPSNPFVGNAAAGAPEVWAYGLRNPWRYSFDAPSGTLFIGDVGQNLFEEVDAVSAPVTPTGLNTHIPAVNFGWRTMEGNHCYDPVHPSTPLPSCNEAGLTLPVREYDHTTGDCAITGGFVYRGTRYPSLIGLYLYADYCSGRIWSLDQPSQGVWRNTLLLDTPYNIDSFGTDESGELYITTLGSGVGGNSIFQLVDNAVARAPAPHATATNISTPAPAPVPTSRPVTVSNSNTPTPLPAPTRH